MRKSLCIFIVFFLCILTTGCLKEREYLTIYGDNEVNVSNTIKLTHNYKGQREVVWTSLNPKVATVDEEGYLTAHYPGAVSITLQVGKSLAWFYITVKTPELVISGASSGRTTFTAKYTLSCVYVKDNIDFDELQISWSVSDETVATINEHGTVTFKSPGTFTVIAKVLGIEVTKEVESLPLRAPSLTISGTTFLLVDEYATLLVSVSNRDYVDVGYVKFEVSDRTVLQIGGSSTMREIRGIKAGTVVVRAYFSKMPDVYDEIVITVYEAKSITLSGKEDMVAGEFNQLNAILSGIDESELVWTTTNPNIATVDENGLVHGVSSGTVTITAMYINDSNIYGIFTINVEPSKKEEISEEDLLLVNNIIENMTLSQKVGQMFAVGFSGNTFSSSLETAINDYNFGNVIYLAGNVNNASTLAKLSNDIQEAVIKANTVPAFITIDQEGGRVARLTKGGTRFISNMAMGAIEDHTQVYNEGKAVGSELRNYGINVDFAPVIDVNNNPDNPVIGTRSYGENPFLVAQCGVELFKGLRASNVMGTAKHFPGHGNTNVDSHSGLPTIHSSKAELYQTELAPFICAINNGIDAIMTTHIVFTAIDDELPATLSEKVLTNLLREELGYDGLIITDGMEMGALKSFGDVASLGLQAVKAGADILLYTDNVNPRSAHTAIMNAVKNGEISEERINESVQRILLKKLKYDVLDNYTAPNKDISELLEENDKLNNEFAMASLTKMKGNDPNYEKSESILIISPECAYNLGNATGDNSLGAYASAYLNSNGYNTSYYTISNNVTTQESKEVIEMLDDYDHVIVACSNVYTAKYHNTGNLVNKILLTKPDTLVIALDTPYDYLRYNEVNNYVCVYCYQKETVVAISKYLNGEFKAVGVSPIDFEEK